MLCMVSGNLSGECKILFGSMEMVSAGHSRLKKEGIVGAHLMKIEHNVWLRFLNFRYSAPGFRMLDRQPVPVEIKPIMVRPCSWPDFIQLPVVGIAVHMVTFMGIDPGGKTVNAVGIDCRIKQQDNIFQLLFDFIGSGTMIGRNKGGVSPAGFVSMNRMSHIHHNGHVFYGRGSFRIS